MKKIIASLLALVLLFSFCACGTPEEEKPNEGKKTDTEDKEAEGEDKPEVEKKLVINDTFYPKYTVYDEYDEMIKKRDEWFVSALENGTLFSAKLGGAEAVAGCEKKVTEGTDEDGSKTYVAEFTDASGMVFVLEATLWKDYPTVDYVVWAHNTASVNSPLLSEFYALDSTVEMPAANGYTVHTANGSQYTAFDFKPVETVLAKQPDFTTFTPDVNDGRSSSGGWPYFDVIGKNCGIMLAIGWSGIWQADFRNGGKSVDLRVSQNGFSSVLLPDEKIRSPRVVLTFFDGDAEYGHNVQRKLIIEHYTPSDGSDDRFVAPNTVNYWGGVRENRLVSTLKTYFDAGINPELVWMDAGWNGDTPLAADKFDNSADNVWFMQRGFWKVNKNIFPSGSLRKVAEAARSGGAEILLWIELETANAVAISKASIGSDCYYNYNKGAPGQSEQLLKLSDKDVLDKTVEFLTGLMKENDVNSIRLDFNQPPQPAWWVNDREEEAAFGLAEGERSGMTQAKYVVNLYELWDRVSAEFDGFVLDNCASGGRRLDIEMTKRGIPMWRTDFDCDNNELCEIRQAQNQWISQWLPLSSGGSVTATYNSYQFRSSMACRCSLTPYYNTQDDLVALKAVLDEFVALRPYWYGSYYQILEANDDSVSWQSYELFREDWQKGILIVIRRPDSLLDVQKLKAKGLLADRNYKVHDIDDKEGTSDFVKSGSELMEKGISFGLSAREIKVYEISIVTE